MRLFLDNVDLMTGINLTTYFLDMVVARTARTDREAFLNLP